MYGVAAACEQAEGLFLPLLPYAGCLYFRPYPDVDKSPDRHSGAYYGCVDRFFQNVSVRALSQRCAGSYDYGADDACERGADPGSDLRRNLPPPR